MDTTDLRRPGAWRFDDLADLSDDGRRYEVVSASSRKTDRFAKPGEYAEAGIPLYWRVETEPDLLLVAYRLTSGSYAEVVSLDHVGTAPAPWGNVHIDLGAVRSAV